MIDLQELQYAIRSMNPRTKLYAVIKEEMEALGHWKSKPRGAAFKKGKDDRRGKIN